MSRREDDTIAVPISALRRSIVIVVVLLVAIVIVAFAATQRGRVGQLLGETTTARYIDASSYQAVFLTNTQVYFGKLSADGDTYLLTDVYYVNTPEGQQTGGQLVKLGNEVHGPREPLIIPARQVVMVENLRDDSQVVQAIRLIKSGQLPATQQPTVTPRPSATR